MAIPPGGIGAAPVPVAPPQGPKPIDPEEKPEKDKGTDKDKSDR